MTENKFYTVREAAEKLNLAEYTVRKKISNKEIQAEKTSNRDGYRIAEDELLNYIKKHPQRNNYEMLPGLGLIPAITAGGVALGLDKTGNGTEDEKRKELARAKLNINRLQDMIDAINLRIEALELEGGYDSLSIDEKKQVLQGRLNAKLIERQIKEIQLQYDLIDEDDFLSEENSIEVPVQLLELRDSGELSREEYKAVKGRISRAFQDQEVILPEIEDEKLDPKYVRNYSEDSFWDKITDVVKKAGFEVIYKALQLYYAAQSPSCPAGVKATIYAALGYFILPLDLIPDIIPMVGFSDDLLAIGTAIGVANMYIDAMVIKKARGKMRSLFGDSVIHKL